MAITTPATVATTPATLPSRGLAGQPLALRAFAVLGGTAVLAAASQVAVPMVPVPLTMQTLAVTLIGAFYGWRLGSLAVLAWLLEGALGLPVFANASGGALKFLGPTGGYLLAFPIVAALTGWLAERGWTGRRVVRSFASMLAGNALCLAIGGAWLAVMIGVGPAIASGVAPFVLGGVLKSILGAAILAAAERSAPAA